MVDNGSKCGEGIEKEMTGSCGDLGPGPVQPRKVREASRLGQLSGLRLQVEPKRGGAKREGSGLRFHGPGSERRCSLFCRSVTCLPQNHGPANTSNENDGDCEKNSVRGTILKSFISDTLEERDRKLIKMVVAF